MTVHGPALPDEHLSCCDCCGRYFDLDDEGRVCDVSSQTYCADCGHSYTCRHPQCDPLFGDEA